jgi:hypothetical protein
MAGSPLENPKSIEKLGRILKRNFAKILTLM